MTAPVVPLTAAIEDTLAFLKSACHERLQPREALQRFGAVQARHSDVGMSLVWEEESYDGSVHYDVLLRNATGATVSLSFCLGGGLPWPLRGVRRWSDADLVQVNGQVLTMREAVELLDIVWNESPIMERMINVCLIREELAQRPIEVSDAELQQGMDGWRRTHRLYTTEATLRWMQQRGMTHERLEEIVTESLTFIKLRERISEGQVKAYIESHRHEFAAAAAGLDVVTRDAVKQALLEEWLTERRRTARVSWYWGTADRTGQGA
jgi:putative peptide maturation system protein